jgi:hypothetical protein
LIMHLRSFSEDIFSPNWQTAGQFFYGEKWANMNVYCVSEN